MPRAALGIRAHSGWGALIAVTYEHGDITILDRRRIPITGTKDAGASQPYHAARILQLPEAETFIANAFEAAHTTAASALREVKDVLSAQKFHIAGCAILMAAGRTLPPLEKILAAHPLLHTAEGVFFREAFAKGCESNAISVTKIKERDLEVKLKESLGRDETRSRKKVQLLGRTIGSPWTADQKNATLAALVLLSAVKKRSERNKSR